MKTTNKDNAKAEFSYVLSTYIRPLFPLDYTFSDVEDVTSTCSKPSIIKDLINYDETSKTFTIYPNTGYPQIKCSVNAPTKYGKHTAQKFLSYAKEILRHIMLVSQYNKSNTCSRGIRYSTTNGADDPNTYRNRCFDIAYEYGLCNALGSAAIFGLLSKMQYWSQKTYEGKKVAFSFIIDTEMNEAAGLSNFFKALEEDYSAVFTDGISSCIHLNKAGQVINYTSATDIKSTGHAKKVAFAPYRFEAFAKECTGPKIGIISQANGDVLVFKQQSLIFVKHCGGWFYLDSNSIVSTIKQFLYRKNETLAKAIYLSILDVSFARAGGCIGIVTKSHLSEISNIIKAGNLESTVLPNTKIEIIGKLINVDSRNTDRAFIKLDRKLRKDFLSLDGATVIDYTGKILCTGTIISLQNTADGTQGGRGAAASELSKHGLGIKISTDGYIKGYSEGKNDENGKYHPHLVFESLR